MNKIKTSTLRKILLTLALGLPFSVNAALAAGLTPAQEQMLSKPDYNVGSLLQQRMKELEFRSVKSQADNMKNNEEKPTQKVEETKPEVPELTLKLTRLEIPESAVLEREELDAIAEKYNDRVVSIKDLYNAVDEINNLYAKKGYLTTRAILPPQRIEGNVVKIMLVEGRIGKISVENNKNTKSSYIRWFINVSEGVIPNMEKLKQNIQLFNSTNSTMLQIKMVAGEEPMTTDFYIVAAESEKRTANVFADNSGSEATGKWRYGLLITDANLTGHCDALNITSLFSRTSETVLVNYDTPIGSRGLRAAINHSENHLRFSEGDAKILDTRGKSKSSGITITKPVKFSPSEKDEWQLDIQRQHSRTTVLGSEFVDDKENRYALSYSSMRVKNNSVFYLKPTYIYNAHKNIDKDSFYGDRITLDTMWQKYKKDGDLVVLRVSAQKGLDDYIPSADQYYLGGQYSVRGYQENVIGGDAGVNAKLDYFWHTKINGLRIVTFFDWGRLSGDTILTTKEIYSCGWGIEYRKKRLAATLYSGYALKKEIGDLEADKNVTHFTINYLFD